MRGVSVTGMLHHIPITPPQRLTGFAGAQDATGAVQLFVKTSQNSSEPSLSNWIGNTGGVVQRLSTVNGTNVPMDLDLSGVRWLWISQGASDPSGMGQGILGQAKIQFGPTPGIKMVPMLTYRYFEGNWDTVPDFDGMVPAKGGLVGDFNLGAKSRADYFGFEYKGFLKIAAAGQYTFSTNSDDGSRLWVDGVEIVNNDGMHGMRECSGNVTLSSGYHAIKVRFFENSGGEGLEVSYQGPGFAKKKIPSDVLFHLDGYSYGVSAKYFEGAWSSLPAFENLTPVTSDLRNNFRISPRNRNDGFGFNFDGRIYIPTGGEYTFFTNSDDGSKLYIDGSMVVDNDGGHTMRERSGILTLTQGFHKIRVTYIEITGSEGLDVKFQGPGIPKVILPSEILFLENAETGGFPASGKDGALTMGGENFDRNYPLSGSQWFKIPLSLYSNNWAHSVVVALDDMNGVVMEGQFQFENGSVKGLSTWFQSFPVGYSGQNEVFFSITVPRQRLYKVRWWFE